MATDTRDHVTISVIGTGSTSGGGDTPTPSGTMAQTPAGQPNLLVNVVPPVIAIAVRFVKTFLTSLVGTFGANQVGLTPIDLGGLKTQVAIAFAVAVIDLVKNVITIFGRLEGKFPLLSGSI